MSETAATSIGDFKQIAASFTAHLLGYLLPVFDQLNRMWRCLNAEFRLLLECVQHIDGVDELDGILTHLFTKPPYPRDMSLLPTLKAATPAN